MVKIEVKGPIVSNDTAWLYHYFGWDACSPKDISKKLAEAAGDDVVLEINSPGGICSYGYEMYTALMEYEGKVTAHVITAASAASLLVCAADEALASDTCIFMIHNTKTEASGDYRQMQGCADLLKEYNEGIINAYVRKTGKPREELQEMMDKETYMSPKTAIEHGFIDGYMFGNPEERDGSSAEPQGSILLQAVNAEMPVIAENRAREIMAALSMMNHNLPDTAGSAVRQQDKDGMPGVGAHGERQDNSVKADSDKQQAAGTAGEGDKKNMTLEEILAEHPEAGDEVKGLLEQARKEGAEGERGRLQELDAISASVGADILNDAKYGENRMDAKELAYRSLVEDGKKAENYMRNAIKDSENSGVPDVGAGCADRQPADESDDMASYVNAKKGERKTCS